MCAHKVSDEMGRVHIYTIQTIFLPHLLCNLIYLNFVTKQSCFSFSHLSPDENGKFSTDIKILSTHYYGLRNVLVMESARTQEIA